MKFRYFFFHFEELPNEDFEDKIRKCSLLYGENVASQCKDHIGIISFSGGDLYVCNADKQPPWARVTVDPLVMEGHREAFEKTLELLGAPSSDVETTLEFNGNVAGHSRTPRVTALLDKTPVRAGAYALNYKRLRFEILPGSPLHLRVKYEGLGYPLDEIQELIELLDDRQVLCPRESVEQ